MEPKEQQSHVAVTSGYLHKAAGHGSLLARWHRRYYVLYSDGLLSSFKNDRARSSGRVIPVGRLCLRMKFGSETSSEDSKYWPRRVSRELCFSIINTDRSYHFYCEDERAFDSWRSKLLQVLNKLSSQSSAGLVVEEHGQVYHSAPALPLLATEEEEEEEEKVNGDNVSLQAPSHPGTEHLGVAIGESVPSQSSAENGDNSVKFSVEDSKGVPEDDLPYDVLETFTVGLVVEEESTRAAADDDAVADKEFDEYMSSCEENAAFRDVRHLEHAHSLKAGTIVEMSFSEMTQPVEAAKVKERVHPVNTEQAIIAASPLISQPITAQATAPHISIIECSMEHEEDILELSSAIKPSPGRVKERLRYFSEPTITPPIFPSFVCPREKKLSLDQARPQPSGNTEAAKAADGSEAKVDRVTAAIQWVDKELKKLVEEIQRLGRTNSDGLNVVEFGVLFEETVNIIPALSGILKTAKKHKIVNYPGELLFQGTHSDVEIVLLTETVSEGSSEKYITAEPTRMVRTDIDRSKVKRTTGFGSHTKQTANAKCFICGKVVYAMEFASANEYVFHKLCFRCCCCSKLLTSSAYATMNDKFYCLPHYERLYMQAGSYSALSQ